ncbi:MAG: GlsB/YeaQ/YmgE family stress response membrane protein, partial [Proteobacteria bacterium]
MIWAVVIGLIVGIVAKFLMPGKDPGGFIITALLGIGGAAFATWLGQTMGMYREGEPAGFKQRLLRS